MSLEQSDIDTRWDWFFVGYCRIPKLYVPSDVITLIINYHAKYKGTLYLIRDLIGTYTKNHEIAQHLLHFSKSNWNFNNDQVNIYRLQSENLNHKSMLPSNPISMRFPQYLSTMTIPKKIEHVTLTIYPPKDKAQFPTLIKFTRIKIMIEETTCKQLIDKATEKLSQRMDETKYDEDPSDVIHESSEFILKVIGAEEYILYDDTLVNDYEAIWKILRFKDISFQMIHCPDFKAIEQECNSQYMNHIAQFNKKYFNVKLLTNETAKKHRDERTLLYCKYGYGDGNLIQEVNPTLDNKDDESIPPPVNVTVAINDVQGLIFTIFNFFSFIY